MLCAKFPMFRRACVAAAIVLSSIIPLTAILVAQGRNTNEPVTDITVTGVLTVLFSDDFTNHRAELVHIVRDERTGKSLRLRFEKTASPDLKSGSRVQIRARGIGDDLHVSGDGSTQITILGLDQSGQLQSSSASPTQLASVTGEQSTLVIVANFRDKVLDPMMPGADCSVAAIRDRVFSDPNGQSVNDLFLDTSLGQVSLNGQVVGPFTLSFSSTDPCDLAAWSEAADSAASSIGVAPTAYSRRVYVMPTNTCPAAGVGELGVAPSRAWVFTCDTALSYAHELGHNLGMQHASTDADEYGDHSDIMGMSGRLKPVNAPHRQQMGWLPDSQISLLTQDGTYDIAPLSQNPSAAAAPQILRVPKPDTTEMYYLSYRTGGNFEANLYDAYRDRISVHRWAGGANKTYLLALLSDGETFVDPSNGFTVTQVSHTTTAATASVHVGTACGATVPSLLLRPPDQSGEPGRALSYDVAIVNNDSSTCSPSTFLLTRSTPTGWTAAFSSSMLSINPGATGHGTLTVTSPMDALAGIYGIPVTVSKSQNAASMALDSAIYRVSAIATADTTPPSTPTNVTATGKRGQISLAWTAAMDNVGVAAYRIWRDGVVVGSTASTTWLDRNLVNGSSHTYVLAAYDAAGNVSSLSDSVQAIAGGGGGGKRK